MYVFKTDLHVYSIREFLYFLVAMHLLHSHKTIKVASCLFFRALSPIRLLFELLSLPEFMEHSPQLFSRKYKVSKYTGNPLQINPTFRYFPKVLSCCRCQNLWRMALSFCQGSTELHSTQLILWKINHRDFAKKSGF